MTITKIDIERAERYISLKEVLKILPIGKSTWWAGIKKGAYPAAIKISERRVVWRLSDIHQIIAKAEFRKS